MCNIRDLHLAQLSSILEGAQVRGVSCLPLGLIFFLYYLIERSHERSHNNMRQFELQLLLGICFAIQVVDIHIHNLNAARLFKVVQNVHTI